VFYKRFGNYISQIPVFGAIILNASFDKILLGMILYLNFHS